MAFPSPWRAIALASALLPGLASCGGDDEQTPAERVAAACSDTCTDIANNCGVPTPSPDACSAACEVGGSLSPDCAAHYEQYVACAGDQPIVACDGASITVSAAATECIDPLSAYLLCAAESVLTACVAVPVQDVECQNAGAGTTAQICSTAPENCTLFEGTLRAEGVGLFCCS